MNTNDLAQKWAEFEKRQERICKRNINSDEYHQHKKLFPLHKSSMSYWSVYASDFEFNFWFSMEESIRTKDLYKSSFEGMLSWINDGEKD